ncbi:MAG: hypothetical protein AABN34_26295 [Acidobacteriota bacterium]
MFGSNALEFALGMVFVYLLLSLLCSALNEAIEARLKNRAKDLELGLRELLKDSTGTGLVKKIYDHPLVSGLFKGTYDPNSKGNLPSYIPARNFALALMEVALPASATTGAKGATAPSGSTSSSGADSIQALRAAINTNLSSTPEVQKALLTLSDAAGDNVNKARENIEAWFNSSMDRVSGWYKRRSHSIVLILGFAVAMGMNADTITIGQRLATDDTLRKTLAATAEASAKQAGAGSTEKTDEQVKKLKEEIEKLGLPVGWKWKSFKDDPSGVPFKAGVTHPGEPDRYENLRWFLTKIVGWLLTAIAISLGAPFWFDILNKIIIVRSTVKPHEKSPEETSKQ